MAEKAKPVRKKRSMLWIIIIPVLALVLAAGWFMTQRSPWRAEPQARPASQRVKIHLPPPLPAATAPQPGTEQPMTAQAAGAQGPSSETDTPAAVAAGENMAEAPKAADSRFQPQPRTEPRGHCRDGC